MTSLRDGLEPFRPDSPRTQFPSAASTRGALPERSVQESELAGDVIEAMSALIYGLTFKGPCSGGSEVLPATVAAAPSLVI